MNKIEKVKNIMWACQGVNLLLFMIKVWTDLNTALFSSSFRLTEPKISRFSENWSPRIKVFNSIYLSDIYVKTGEQLGQFDTRHFWRRFYLIKNWTSVLQFVMFVVHVYDYFPVFQLIFHKRLFLSIFILTKFIDNINKDVSLVASGMAINRPKANNPCN